MLVLHSQTLLLGVEYSRIHVKTKVASIFTLWASKVTSENLFSWLSVHT